MYIFFQKRNTGNKDEKGMVQIMHNLKKTWIIMVLFATIELLAFPKILFPDCIRKNEIEYQNEDTMEENYCFKSYFLIFLNEKVQKSEKCE